LLGDHEFDQSENGHRHAEKFLKNFNQTDQDHLKKLLKTRTVTDRDSLFTYFAPDVVDNSVDVQIIGMLDRDTLIRNKNLDQDFFTPKRQQNLLKMPGINKLR
jgi:hypothetical protein